MEHCGTQTGKLIIACKHVRVLELPDDVPDVREILDGPAKHEMLVRLKSKLS
jgi:hypothetical protein